MFWSILLIGLIILLVLVAIGVYVSSSSERNLMEERLGKYLEQEGSSKKQEQREQSTAFSEWVNKRVERSSFGEQISRNLARADLKFRPGEFVAFMVIVAVTLAGLAWFLGGSDTGTRSISALIGGVLGLILPIIYLRTQQGTRLKKFNQQLPDMLNLMVNGLRAGYSTMQAMEAISRELPAPLSEEFRRVVQEMQLGVSMEKALDNLLRRIPSEDLDFVVTAMNVQREVGGPLAEILDTISYTIRERIRIKGEIRVMTSQVVMSGRILSLVPFGVFILLWFINQSYMREFFNPDNLVCGISAIGTGVVMIGIGYAIMMKIADIEV